MNFLNKIFYFFERFLFFLPVGVFIFVFINSSSFWFFQTKELFFFSSFFELIFLFSIQYIGIIIILIIYYLLFKNLFMYSIQYYVVHLLFSFKTDLFLPPLTNFHHKSYLLIEDFLNQTIFINTYK